MPGPIPRPWPDSVQRSRFGAKCIGLEYGEPTAEELALCTEAPEVEDMVEGGWSKELDAEFEGEPGGVYR